MEAERDLQDDLPAPRGLPARPFLKPDRLASILLAIPAYNEERFIGSLVLQARSMGLSVLVIDDGSTDQTAEIATAAGALVERHSANAGKSEALNTAFQTAHGMAAEALIVLDGDGQHDVRAVEPFLELVYRGEADIVVGSRFLPHSGGAIPGFRRAGQRAMTTLANFGSGTAVTDSQSGFRAFSRQAIDVVLLRSQGFSAEVEMQFLARSYGLRLLEVPITASYVDPPRRNVLSHGAQVLNGVLSLVGRHRPLLFFGCLGALLMLAGLVVGFIVATIQQSIGILPVGYSLISVLLLIGGLLSLYTGVLLHSIRGTFLDLDRRLASVAARTAAQPLEPE